MGPSALVLTPRPPCGFGEEDFDLVSGLRLLEEWSNGDKAQFQSSDRKTRRPWLPCALQRAQDPCQR